MSRPDYTLTDDFELKGMWWLPNNPDKQISGMLQFAHKGKITLDLIGSFREIQSFGSEEFSTPEVILGISDNGFICTLVNTFETNRQLNFPGIPKSQYQARFLILGHHFDSFNDISFTSVKVSYTNLENWLSARPLTLTKPKGDLREKWEISFHFPPEFKVYVDSIDADIESTHDLKTKGDLITKSGFTSSAYIKFTPRKAQNLQWYLNIHHDFSNLLTILIGKTVYPKSIKAAKVNVEEDHGLLTILHSQDSLSEQKVDHHDMIIPHSKLCSCITSVFNSWFSNKESLRSVYDIFFGTKYNPDMFSELHFLSLMQAVESFHRSTKSGKYLEDDDWKKHKDHLISKIPNELETSFKESLKSRLRYGNEYSLRKRIQELINTFDDEIIQKLSFDKKFFTGILVDTRNYFTHYDVEARETALSGEELYWAIVKLEIFIIALLLKQIGFDQTTISSALSENKQFSKALSHNRH